MDGMLMLAGGAASLQTITFTTPQTWIAPMNVSSLASLSGRGAAGSPETTGLTSAVCVVVNYDTTQYPPGETIGNYGWGTAYSSDAASAVNFLNNTGTFYAVTVNQYGHSDFGDTHIRNSSLQNAGAYVHNSAYLTYTGGFATSGDIRASGTAVLNWQYPIAATGGAGANAFGKNFPGGFGGPATVQNYGPQSITPGGSYPIAVPAGSQVTITYYS